MTSFIKYITKNALLVFLTVALSLLSLLIWFYVSYHWHILYDLFYFYFESSYSEFKLWFPSFYTPVYFIIQLIKVVFFAIVLIVGYKLILKILEVIKKQFAKNKNPDWYNLLYVSIGFISLFFLAYYSLPLLDLKFIDVAIFQLFWSRIFVLGALFFVVFKMAIHGKYFIATLKDFLFTPTLPYNISILRILFFSYLIFIYTIKYFFAKPIIHYGEKVHLPLVGWFVDIVPVSESIYLVFVALGIIFSLFIVVGFKTRMFLILNAICVLYIMAVPNFYGKLWHDQIIVWITWVFAASNCYDVYSIDSRNSSTAIKLSAKYNFPVKFILLQIGIIYFWAGFYKIWDAGFEWALGESMINQVQLEWVQHYDKIPAIRIDKVPLLLHIGGVSVIFFELLFMGLVIFQKTRKYAALGGLLMHNIIGYFMYISFLMWLQVFYVFFIDFNYFYKNKPIEASQFEKRERGVGVVIISVIVFINFIFGMFNIHSYPFSAYPSYSAIIPSNLKIIEFNCPELNKTLHEIGKENGFIWENYGWNEYRLINDFESGKDNKIEFVHYWNVWVSGNPQLKNCDTVSISIIERPLSPERKEEIKVLHKNFLYFKNEHYEDI